MKKTGVVVLGLMLALTGCATGPAYQEAPAAKSGEALVYLFRPSAAVWGLRDVTIALGGKDVADLGSGGYTWMHVPAGQYVLAQRWPSDLTRDKEPIQLATRWEAGKSYYYRVETWRDGGLIRWRFAELEKDSATAQIKQCRYQQAAGFEKLKGKHIKTSADLQLEELGGLVK